MTTAIREKTLHRLFLISVWIKGGCRSVGDHRGSSFFLRRPEGHRTLCRLTNSAGVVRRSQRLDRYYSQPWSPALDCRYRAICRCLSCHSRSHQDFPGRWPLSRKIVGIPDVALVSRRVHRLPMLSLHVHAFDLACPVSDSRRDRGVFDLARVSVAQTDVCSRSPELTTKRCFD
jgi:hypothetical protein